MKIRENEKLNFYKDKDIYRRGIRVISIEFQKKEGEKERKTQGDGTGEKTWQSNNNKEKKTRKILRGQYLHWNFHDF